MKLVIFFNLFLWINAVNGNSKNHTYETKYLDVSLDHFQCDDKRTFPLRYLINTEYWEKSGRKGPIFFINGAESNVKYALNLEFAWKAAEKFQALICFCEHRYYGKSKPFGNASFTTPENFRYLTTTQALADFVDVINHLKSGEELTSKDAKSASDSKTAIPVFILGCSYGGMLSAWMRMTYPDAVQGALASSGPIWEFEGIVSPYAFHEFIAEKIKESSEKCFENVQKSSKILRVRADTADGKTWFLKNWKLCTPLESNDDVDMFLKGFIIDAYAYINMYNYPQSRYGVPANPLNVMCKILEKDFGTNEDDLLAGVFNAINIYYNRSGVEKCLEWNDTSDGSKAWNIQICTEMPDPIGTSKDSPFEYDPWDEKTYSEKCSKTYKAIPEYGLCEIEYGGKNIKNVTNIIFSNGKLDPYSTGGVTKAEEAPLCPVMFLDGCAHCSDLHAADTTDSKSLIEARIQYMYIFRNWIQDYRKSKGVPRDNYDLFLDSLKF